jgi:hypothetical protein
MTAFYMAGEQIETRNYEVKTQSPFHIERHIQNVLFGNDD